MKSNSIFLMSVIAMLAAANAHANIASQGYVDEQVQPVASDVATLKGGANVTGSVANSIATAVANKQNKSSGVSVGGADGAWNTLAQGTGIGITTDAGTTTIAVTGNYVIVPTGNPNASGKQVLTYDPDTDEYAWELIGR